MDDSRRQRLRDAGFEETTIDELLDLTPEDRQAIERRMETSRRDSTSTDSSSDTPHEDPSS